MAVSHVVESRTTLSNDLKYRYEGALRDITPERSVTLSLLKKELGKTGWGGKSITVSLGLNFFGSASSAAESGYLPDSTPINVVNAVIPMKWHYFSVACTGQAMATTRDNADAFAEAWATQVMYKLKSHAQHMNRQSLGDGNGYLAQVDGSPALSGSSNIVMTLNADNAFGISGMNNSDVNGHTFISTNEILQFYSSSTKRCTYPVRVTSWSRGDFPSTSAEIVCSCTANDCDSVADGDYIYTQYGYGNEAAGLRLLIDDNTIASTVQSLSATTYSEWRSQMGYGSTHGTAEALTRMRMMNMQTAIEAAGGNTKFILTSPAVWLTYGDTCAAENVPTNMKVMDNGFTTCEFNGVAMYKDPVMWDEMFWVDTDTIKIYEVMPEGWMDLDGSVIKMSPDRKDEWEAYWQWYMNFGTTDRSKNGKLVDITVRANQTV